MSDPVVSVKQLVEVGSSILNTHQHYALLPSLDEATKNMSAVIVVYLYSKLKPRFIKYKKNNSTQTFF